MFSFVCVYHGHYYSLQILLHTGNYKQIITVYIQYRTIYARASLSTLLRASAKSGPDIVSMAIDPCACNDVFCGKGQIWIFWTKGARTGENYKLLVNQVYHSADNDIRSDSSLLLCLCWVYLNVYKCTYICFHLLEISNFLATRSLLCLLALHPNRDVGKQEKSPTVVPLSHLSSAFPKEWCDICLSFRGRGESLKLSKNEPCLDIYTAKSD